MQLARLCLRLFALLFALTLGAYLYAIVADAQTRVSPEARPDVHRVMRARAAFSGVSGPARKGGYQPHRSAAETPLRPRLSAAASGKRIARPAALSSSATNVSGYEGAAAAATGILPGTPLSRILHTSQLSSNSSAGTNEQYHDRTRDLVADERTTFDSDGGSFDIALGRSGTRYEVFSGTLDGQLKGFLRVAVDTNGNYVRDSSTIYDLRQDFGFRSAASVVSGTSNAGREFVVVSSSGYYNETNANDPFNEPSPGVLLLVRDFSTGGFDSTRTRELVRVGSDQLYNANAMALLPNNDLLIADFTSNELRIVRDTNADGIPDTLDNKAYYTYRFSNDAPLDVAVNSRGVVFSHSYGADAVMLAIYDDNNDGYGDADEVVVEGLSLDNNLFLHGLTVDREGNVYVIEDASGSSDTADFGGNGGSPRVDAFPDPALNGFLRDGFVYAVADLPSAQFLTGLAFGVDTVFGPVRSLALTNSASRVGNATRDGLGTILGTGLTRGASGASAAEALAKGISVTVEGQSATVLSFNDTQVHIHVPDAVGAGTRSVVVTVGGDVTAAEDVTIATANPGIFTTSQTGAGEAIALLASGFRETRGPFPAQTDGQPSVVMIFGTGWRKSLPVSATLGGQPVQVQYAGPSGGFPGMDQLNVTLPGGLTGTLPLVVKTANGATSRGDVTIGIQ